MKILSVDDSQIMRRIIRNAVELMGFEFAEAPNGFEAFNVLELEKDIGLILLDWNMPGMDGLEVLRKLKADKRYKEIPVAMVTTEGDRSKIIQAIQNGAKTYVVKPFTQEILVEKIMGCLGMGA